METNNQVFAFRLYKELFCLPVAFVRVVTPFQEGKYANVTVVSYDDILIPLIELSLFVNTPPMVIHQKQSKQIVIVEVGNKLAGICVDETCGIFTIAEHITRRCE